MSYSDENDFGKQRRNLMLISGLIFLHSYLEIDYSKAQIFGITAKNINHLSIVILIMWIYFFIRFFTIFFEKGERHDVTINSIYQKKLTSHFTNHLRKKVNKDSFSYKSRVTKHTPWEITFDYKVDGINKTGVFTPNGKEKIQYHLISTWHYIFKNHYFFEYYFPIIFGLLPLWTLLK